MVCECNHYAPEEEELCSLEYNAELAAYLDSLGLSADGIAQWMLDMLYERHFGELYDHEDRLMDVRCDVELMDKALRFEDLKRTINRFLERAKKPFKRKLQKRLIRLVTLLSHARVIAWCITEGPCSRR